MPFKMQLAIQGGGARLALLMAAASPIQTLIRNKDIELTRVVGTSAGAIVAAFLAADIDIETFRQVLLARREELLRSFGKHNMAHIGWCYWRGERIWNPDMLQQLLEAQFKPRKINTIADAIAVRGTELQIIYTDLADGDGKPFPVDKPVVGALLDSCGLPGAFKTYKTGSVVDGGIAHNFAWENLSGPAGSNAKYGPVIGIMLDREIPNKAPETALQFTGALLSTAIDSATERARAKLGKGQIFSIPADFGTFEIEKGLGQGLNADYMRTKESAERWIGDFLDDPDAVRGDIWSDESMTTMTKTARMYKNQHSGHLIEYERVVMRYYPRGLERKGEYDIVEYEMKFKTLDDPIYCHKMALSQVDGTNTGFLKSSWVLSDDAGNKIGVTYVPILDDTTPTKREVLAYFDTVLPKNSGPYTLTIKDLVRDLCKPLREEKKDPQLVQLWRSNRPAGEVHIVVYLPEKVFKGSHWTEVTKSGLDPGKAMMPNELTPYEARNSADYNFKVQGWKGSNVAPNQEFGAELHI